LTLAADLTLPTDKVPRNLATALHKRCVDAPTVPVGNQNKLKSGLKISKFLANVTMPARNLECNSRCMIWVKFPNPALR
jgi:hypothetical protein